MTKHVYQKHFLSSPVNDKLDDKLAIDGYSLMK